MKFLVDAQLPRRLVYRLQDAGFKAMHTLDLPHGNRTQDDEINALSVREQWIVVSKDRDFVDSFLVQGIPYKLLLVTTGNITNAVLETLFIAHLEEFNDHSYLMFDEPNLGRTNRRSQRRVNAIKLRNFVGWVLLRSTHPTIYNNTQT